MYQELTLTNLCLNRVNFMQKQKTTKEIQTILENANIDFDLTVNEALNAYLPKIMFSCPFTEEVCNKKQCIGCESSNAP